MRHGSGRMLFTLKRSGGELFSDALTDSVAFATILEPSAVERRTPPSCVSVAGARGDCRSARRAAAATTGTSYQPGGGVNALRGGCA